MKRLLCGLLLTLVGAMAFAASASAAGYTAYVACGLNAEAPPSESCQLGETPGAFFESPEEDVEYDVCVEFPSGTYLCAEEQEALEGVLYVNKITTSAPGLHFVDWYVEGSLIATWAFEMLAPPPPPPVVVTPPPAIAPVAPPVSTACVQAKQKAKRLQGKLRDAEGRKARARARAKLRAARAKVKSLC